MTIDKSKNRLTRVSVRLTEKEGMLLNAIADADNRDMSEMLRELIREGAVRRGIFEVNGIRLLSKYEVKREAND